MITKTLALARGKGPREVGNRRAKVDRKIPLLQRKDWIRSAVGM